MIHAKVAFLLKKSSNIILCSIKPAWNIINLIFFASALKMHRLQIV